MLPRARTRRKTSNRNLDEYYFYGGGYKEISPQTVRNFKLDSKFKVGSIYVEIYYSPQFQDETSKRNINEYLEKFIKETREVEKTMINVSMLQNVKVSYSVVWCKKRLRLFIRTP